jgi:hypothetical protein
MAKENKNTLRPNDFKVPDGYFESFESRMMQKIQDGKTTPFQSIKKSKVMAPWIGLAASFLIIALIYQLIPQKMITNQMQGQNEAALIYEYSTADYFNEFELMELLTNEGQTNYELYPDSLFFKGIDEEDIVMLTSIR